MEKLLKKYALSAALTFFAAFLTHVLFAMQAEGVEVWTDIDWPLVLSSGSVVAVRAALAGIVAAFALAVKPKEEIENGGP